MALRSISVEKKTGQISLPPSRDLLWTLDSLTDDFVNAPSASMEVENVYDFTTDQEILSAMEEASNDDATYSEEYRRCFRVWLRIANYPQAKNFMWDVDTNTNPDYYLVIKRPMTFSQVALNLLKKCYISIEFGDIAKGFYRDMKQVLLNCFAYNTEATAIVSQAQRLLQSLHRHVMRWIFSPPLPSIHTCTDQFCLYTSTPLISNPIHHVSIKCGRCLGLFSIDALHAHQKERAIILPTQDQVHGSDEWYCMYCLQEDTVIRDNYHNQVKADHFFDEWGPSCIIPWMFDRSLGTFLDPLLNSSPQIQSMMEALHILSSTNRTSLLQSTPTSIQTWSFQERLCVLAAICEVLKGHEISFQYLHKIYSECITLSKMSFREPFHEGDFMNQVMKISGAEGVIVARALLEGNDLALIEEETIKHSVIEGRCIICKESTFEDDCDGKRVLLCDGCNAETHLDCVGLTSIPKGAWYCPPCKQRLDQRFESDGYMSQLDDIQDLCNKEEEHKLITEEIIIREGERIAGKRNEVFFIMPHWIKNSR